MIKDNRKTIKDDDRKNGNDRKNDNDKKNKRLKPIDFSDPKKDLFYWGPISGRMFYHFGCASCVARSKELIGRQLWPRSLLLYRCHDNGSSMVWINNTEELETFTIDALKEYIFSPNRHKMYDTWRKKTDEMHDYSEHILNAPIDELSKKDISAALKKIENLFIDSFTLSMAIEAGNYGAIPYLEKKLSKYLDMNELTHGMSILTAPEELSFYQEEEMELFHAKDIKKHSEKYAWLKNSYGGTQNIPLSFFIERKKALTDEKIKEIKGYANNVLVEKREYCKENKLPEEILEESHLVAWSVARQDERKKENLYCIQAKEKLLIEIAKRLQADIDLLRDYSALELSDVLDKNAISPRRWEGFLLDFDGTINYDDKETEILWNTYVEIKTSPDSELKGDVASKGAGSVKGNIRIVRDPHNASFKEGEILVCPMTTPDYVFLIKKSSAIITDVGGYTSHAAVTSRELRKLCITNTRVATQILKDGDLVEIDADKGVVKILKKKVLEKKRS